MIKGWGPTGTGSMKNINLGLDLSGGVSITYQAVKDNPTDEEMSDTRYKLEQRAQQYSEEAQVYLQGDNRITIEIPGATDATTILEEMGKPGSLYFIKQTNDDGTENYTYDSTTGEYVLNGKTIEELEEDGSVVLTGKDVESAEAMHQQNSTTKSNRERRSAENDRRRKTENLQTQPRKPTAQERASVSTMMKNSSVYRV